MPFGLCNTPNTFFYLMDSGLTGLKWEICFAYLDDINAFTKHYTSYLNWL